MSDPKLKFREFLFLAAAFVFICLIAWIVMLSD
jgi:hypothetical protein